MKTKPLFTAGFCLSAALALLVCAGACTGTNIGNPGGQLGRSDCNEELVALEEDEPAVADPNAASEVTATELVESLVGDYSASFQWRQGYFDDSTTQLMLKVTAKGPLYRVLQTQKEQGTDGRLYEACPDYLRFDAEIEFETADGGFSETVQTAVSIVEEFETEARWVGARFQLDADALQGSFVPQRIEIPEDAKNERYALSFTIRLLEGEAAGEVHVFHEYEESGDAHSGGGSDDPIGSFGAEQ